MNDVSLSELKSRDSSVILKSSIISEENIVLVVLRFILS